MISILKENFFSSSNTLLKKILKNKFNKDSTLKMLQSGKININEQDNNGDTIIHLCIKHKKYTEAIWFIQQDLDLDLDLENDSNLNIVRLAVCKGAIDVLRELINYKKIDIDQVDYNKRSLTQDSIMHGHNDITHLLLQLTKDINNLDKNNRNLIFDTISYGDPEITDKVIAHKDIDLNVIDNDGNTILHSNDVINNEEIAIKLLENGADPTTCNNEGTNFLTKIALKGETGEAMLNVAIRMGCDLNTKTSNNNSILMEVMYAFSKIPSHETFRRKQFKNIARKLIQNGIDVKSVNNQNETVLFDLVRASDIEGCAFVLENGLEVNQINKNLETALSLSVLKGVENLDIILLLLQYGADANIKNRNNECVLEVLNNIILHVHSSRVIKDKKILSTINPAGNYLVVLKEIIKGTKCEFTYLDSEGSPLYIMPFLLNNIALTKIYINNGVDINIKDKEGYTLFYLYVLSQFEKNEFSKEFRTNLTFLLINGANILAKNKNNQTIFSVVSSLKKCNLALFRQLIEITKYDYTMQDNKGRTIMHSCVWGDNLELIEIIYGVERNIQNIADNYGILPITYASLFGNKEIVIEFLKRGSNITSGQIPQSIKKYFNPMLKNLEKLIDEDTPKDSHKNINILKDTIKKDFELKAS